MIDIALDLSLVGINNEIFAPSPPTSALLFSGTADPDFVNWSISASDAGAISQSGNNIVFSGGDPANVELIQYVGTTAAGVLDVSSFTGAGNNQLSVALGIAQITDIIGMENLAVPVGWTVNANGNLFTTTTVNQMLADAVASMAASGASELLIESASGDNPPSGAGLTNYQALVTAGWGVSTDLVTLSATLAGDGKTLTCVFAYTVTITDATGFSISDSNTLTYVSGSGTDTLVFTLTTVEQHQASISIIYDGSGNLEAGGIAIPSGLADALITNNSMIFSTNVPGTYQITNGNATSYMSSVQGIGASGAGGSSGATTAVGGGGGGAGGQWVTKSIVVPSGESLNIVVPAVTAGGTGNGATGADFTCNLNGGSNLCVAKGGAGGDEKTVSGAAGGVGSTTGGVGDTVNAGGNGSAGGLAVDSGSGGGSGTAAGTGANASGLTPGGNGGAGLTTSGVGNAGSMNSAGLGGGGGGAYRSVTGSVENGGNGSGGWVSVA